MKKRYKNIMGKAMLTILFLLLGYSVYAEIVIDKKKEPADAVFDFTLEDLEGNQLSLEDYKGKGMVVNFWATYCPPCKKELPYFEKIYQEYGSQGVEVVAINVGEPLIAVNSFLSKNKVSFPILLDQDQQATEAFKIITLPVTLFINSEGEIVEKINGEASEQMLRENVMKIVH